ncbi:DNA-binding SMUBP-2 [Chlorella sorokiniana]|uniref:DNA-binding SMUBP-2 n=1 Tax=Chlorella sorokiniana TaxID=3076 RepID=A0A2P6U0R5_CHLSO|nr:DNA-binding SMUBP-2 [Chlorella sorokiniana]|eukprot:PRW59890.1 DNA-binding SMUBP-2 [Chlorella sorokiniana]
MQRYVPPSRRGQTAGEAAAEQRGLEGASHSHEPSQVRLVLLREDVEIDPAACPLDCERQEGSTDAYTVFYPDRLPSELLRWFAEACASGAGRLEFPATLSKQERARWHGLADRARLHTQSVGVGEGRYLTIGTAPLEGGGEGGGGAAAGRLRLTSKQVVLARFIYDAAQMEGGKHWERSRGEIEALVASGQPLPADLQAIVDKRERGERVNALLKAGQPSQALELLADDPKLAWVKDAESGGYPLHIAAWHGYESVALFLASLPGCLEQRDGRRETALAGIQQQ